MKKLFFVFAISSLGFVACNSATEGEATDATEATETPAVEPAAEAPADTTVNMDTTAAPSVADTAVKM